MKSYGLAALGVCTSLLATASMPGPEPPPVHVQVPTPASLNFQFQREALQEQYDTSEEVAASVLRAHGCTDEFAEPAARSAIDLKVPVRVIVAVIVVESTCRPDVISSEGAVGLMQVVPRVWHVPQDQLKDPEFNIRKGTEILAAYFQAHGVREGLHRYNGTGTDCDACDTAYPDKVLLVAGYRR